MFSKEQMIAAVFAAVIVSSVMTTVVVNNKNHNAVTQNTFMSQQPSDAEIARSNKALKDYGAAMRASDARAR